MLLSGLCLMSGLARAQASAPIHSGASLDYQPAPLRLANGELLVVIERLAPKTNLGDLLLTRSRDGGTTWDAPVPIVSTPLSERHPALVQLPDGGLALFYLVLEGGGINRIHRATSPDGTRWTRRGALDLGWGDGKELNPSVILEPEGTLTLAYQRQNGAAYLARSTDGGATWDTLRTQLSEGWAALPRITRRDTDGLYVVTYQVNPGNYRLQLRSKASTNPYDWSAPSALVSGGANTHDSQPLTLEDGTFLVTYIEQVGSSAFDLYYRLSPDGLRWSEPQALTASSANYDIQPHPILQGSPGRVSLFWSCQSGATPYSTHDIWMMRDLAVLPLPWHLEPTASIKM